MDGSNGAGSRIRKRISTILPQYRDDVTHVCRNWFQVNDKADRISGHNHLGQFYEYVPTAIWGGTPACELFPHMDIRRLPDNLYPHDKIIEEVKGVHIYSETQLRNSQIRDYKIRQALYPDWRIRFTIFNHTIPEIKKYDMPLQGLFEKLAHSATLLCVMIDFPLILKLFDGIDASVQDKGRRRLVRHYTEIDSAREGSKKYESCSCIYSRIMRDFMYAPGDIIAAAGMNPDDFEIERTMSPKHLYVRGFKMMQFPITALRYKHYISWSEEFSQTVDTGISEDAEIPPEFGIG